MRITHIYKDYHPKRGGIENHVKVLAEAQAAAGHEVTVLTCGQGLATAVSLENGVQVVRAGRLATVASMPLSPALVWRLLGLTTDVAHVHSPFPLGEAANWLLGRTGLTVWTHHSDVVRQRMLLRVYGPLLARALDAADVVIATSPTYIETSPWLAPRRGKCVVIPLGVDLERFLPPADDAQREETLLFVGRHCYYKGLEDVLAAMATLPRARLDVLGDGPYRGIWETEARRLGLESRVRFLGEVDDAALAETYRRAGILVLPSNSRAEAFGTVLLEAMACGLPCVTTELGSGTSWVVRHGITGLVVPPRDPRTLALALGRLLMDPGERRAMGQAGRERAEALFDVRQMIRDVEAIYMKGMTTR